MSSRGFLKRDDGRQRGSSVALSTLSHEQKETHSLQAEVTRQSSADVEEGEGLVAWGNALAKNSIRNISDKASGAVSKVSELTISRSRAHPSLQLPPQVYSYEIPYYALTPDPPPRLAIAFPYN